MTYKVERNNATGALGCHFEHGRYKYYAVVRPVPMSEYTECTIYPETVLDTIWEKWDVPLTEEGLIDCIGAFIAKMDADQGRGSGNEKTCTVCRSVSV